MSGVREALEAIRREMDHLDGEIRESRAFSEGVRLSWPDGEVNDPVRACDILGRYVATLLADALATHEAIRGLALALELIEARLDHALDVEGQATE